MSREFDARSPLVRFLDSFFQEQNIKWMLGVGLLTVFGSSLMLVTSHWQDYSLDWKYFILIGYTVLIFASGELCYRRLGLRRSGTVLMALTVLLIPLTFLALHWVRPEAGFSLAELGRRAGLVGLLAVNGAFSLAAARRIFEHFLHGPQPTFVFSYLTLAIAGAFVPALPAAWLPGTALLLWGVFAAGAVKVNRHVFWLAEEHRLPRIFGFFPIALLGTQFLTLFAVHIAAHIPLAWIGLGCVLTAIPVLLTADAVARVHQQRTGDLVRPWPLGMTLPFVIGLALCAAGVCLAATGMPRPHALVPTAALAAGLMAIVARRTGHSAFVWAMLAGVVLAYQFSPMFFRDLAQTVVQQGAAAVREERLPYAFYGLTYLPLLIVTTAAAWSVGRTSKSVRQRAVGTADDSAGPHTECAGYSLTDGLGSPSYGDGLFAGPLRRFAIGLAGVLLIAAFGHPKAIFPVGAAMTAMFVLQTVLFRDRRLTVPAVLSFLTAAIGVTPFVGGVFGLFVPGDLPFLCLAIAAGLLFVPGRMFDRLAAALPPLRSEKGDRHPASDGNRSLNPEDPGASPPFRMASETDAALETCQIASLLVTLVVGGTWLVWFITQGGATAWLTGPLLTMLLFAHALKWLKPGLSEAALVFAGLTTLTYAARSGVEMTPLLAGGTLALIGLRLTALGLETFSRFRVSRAFAAASYRVSLGGLVLVAVASLVVFTVPMRAAGGIALVGLLLSAVLERQTARRQTLLCLVNWQALSLVVQATAPGMVTLLDLKAEHVARFALPAAAFAAFSLLVFQFWGTRRPYAADDLLEPIDLQRGLLRMAVVAVLAMSVPVLSPGLSPSQIALAAFTFAALMVSEFRAACRDSDETRVWTGLATAGLAVGYFALLNVLTFGAGISLFIVLGCSMLLWGLGRLATRWRGVIVLSRPFLTAGWLLPLGTVGIGIYRHLAYPEPAWLGMNSLALLLAAGFYFWQGLERRQVPSLVLSAVILNIALALLWGELKWSDPQFYLVPLGVSVLGLVELLRKEIPDSWHDPLRYLGALTILVSPTFHIVGGSWTHLLTLMLASVAVTLLSIGLRVRALMYTGTAFLAADLLAMIVRGSFSHPSLLWLAGIGIGGAVIVLAAVCENHRETLLGRLRRMAAELETWR